MRGGNKNLGLQSKPLVFIGGGRIGFRGQDSESRGRVN